MDIFTFLVVFVFTFSFAIIFLELIILHRRVDDISIFINKLTEIVDEETDEKGAK